MTRCFDLIVAVGTPYGLFSWAPFDFEYVLLINGTGVIYRPSCEQLCMN